jgi:hypothetical protein
MSVYRLYNDKNYIGSTTQSIKIRIKDHMKDYRRFLKGTYHYISSFEVVKNEFKYEILEEVKEGNLKERERFWITQFECVNIIRKPIQTNEERLNDMKDYYKNVLKERRKRSNTNKKKSI